MENKKTNSVSTIFILIVGIVGLIIFANQTFKTRDFNSFSDYISKNDLLEIKTPNGIIQAEVSTSSSALELGLSDRSSLGQDKGMLFVFAKEDKQGFWMKDMRFALDIIWLDKNKKVITIEKALSPSTYPNVYFPNEKAKYVLEINAYAVDKYKIATGTTLTFEQ